MFGFGSIYVSRWNVYFASCNVHKLQSHISVIYYIIYSHIHWWVGMFKSLGDYLNRISLYLLLNSLQVITYNGLNKSKEKLLKLDNSEKFLNKKHKTRGWTLKIEPLYNTYMMNNWKAKEIKMRFCGYLKDEIKSHKSLVDVRDWMNKF